MSFKNRKGVTRRRLLQQFALGMGVASAGMILPGKATAAKSLQVSPTGPSKRVLVLGAGLAGLAAAWELEEAEHEVTVLEARTRPGGRVYTLRPPFADYLYAEAGAVAFSSAYTEANRYIDALGLERADWKIPDLRSLYHLKGHRFSVGSSGHVEWPYKLTEAEQRLGPMGIIKRYVLDTLPEEISGPESWKNPALKQLDQISLGAYMQGKGASRGAVELIRDTQWFGMAVDKGSALSSAVADFGLFMAGRPFLLSGGNDRLPMAMANRLRRSVQYGVRVVAVRQNEEGVQVTARRGDKSEEYRADRVVCTLPATVLREVRFEPDLPDTQRDAVMNIPYLDTTRTFIQVRRGFWYDEGVTGSATTDLPVQQISRQPFSELGGPEERSILESHVRGPSARNLAAKPENEIIEYVLQDMAKVHPKVGDYQEGGVVKAWSEDPFAHAAYSWPAPGDVTRYLEPLQRPHGRVHFAGEHTSIFRGLMEGALRSGIRAAKEVTGSE